MENKDVAIDYNGSGHTIKLDDAPLNRFHIKIAGLTFGAHFTDGYILGIIAFALALLTPQMELTPFWIGLIGSSALIGLFLGSLVLGWISDYIGRQKIFVFSFIVITAASILQFFADSPTELVLYRILLGIGLGGDYSVGHTMLAEFSPRKHRGVLLGSFSVVWTFGYVVANLIGILAVDSAPDAWRWMLASSAIPAVIILILRMGTPESPRWLISKGRLAEAREIVKKHVGPNIVLDDERPVQTKSSFVTLFRKDLRKRTAFNCIFFVCLVIPYFAIYTFLPSILDAIGLNEGYGTDFLLNGLLIVGAILGIWFTVKFSRRGFLISSFIILIVTLTLLSILPSSATVIMILSFAIFTLIMSAVSNLVGVFPAESFPTEIRSSGVGLATAISRLGSAIGTFLLPIGIATMGIQFTMLFLTAVLIIGAIVSIAWAPETKSLTLSEASNSGKTNKIL
ncbi:MFS transporter [Peribacillus muralis]|uniref:MFS transporter n=1 Tax=Peribacillus muralis TaxID=264697 RepID=UPI001F4EBFC9|nr:MFS transporter [Peribacillus muralis]MCK1993259.1 MFS transporter [Peribacillus muralis]MCK2013813.1 MFS transporter [Peribacillus muralis]